MNEVSVMERIVAMVLCGDEATDPRAVELAQKLSSHSTEWEILLWRQGPPFVWADNFFGATTQDAVLPQGDVLFLHSNDRKRIPSDRFRPPRIVEFSGGGMRTTRTDTYCPVEPPFSPGNCPLTNSHLDAIRDWILGTADTPVISHAEPVDHLVAAVVLCQGYLAAHFPEPAKDISGDVRQALETMGWTPAAIGAIITAGNTHLTDRERIQTENPGWWQHVFGTDDSRFREQMQSELRHLRSDNEPGLQSLRTAVHDLQNAIYNSSSIQDSNLIARFYSAAAAVLDEEAR
jgi:hypothetical protein